MIKQKKRFKFSFVITCLIFLVSLFLLLKALFLGLYPDFSVYYYGSKYFISGKNAYEMGKNLYSGYSYPPVVLLLFVPFTMLPFASAEFLWTLLNFVFLFVSLFMLAKIFSISWHSKMSLLLMSLVFISFPTKFTFGMGQINIFILLLMVLSLWFLKQKKEMLSGVFLGVSLMIKFFPILLPFYFLVKKQTTIIVGLIFSIIAAVLFMLVFVPLRTNIYFINKVVPGFFSESWKLDYYSQSLSAFVGRTFGIGEVGSMLKILLTIVVITIIFIAVIKNRKKNFESFSLQFGAIITATILTNTFSWQHHFVWLVIPFYATLFYLKKQKFSKKYFILLIASYILVSTNLKNPEIVPVLFRSHVFYGSVILLGMQTKLLLDKKSES